MKTLSALLTTLAAGPALAHADGSVHMHGTDGAVWLALALAGGALAVALLRR